MASSEEEWQNQVERFVGEQLKDDPENLARFGESMKIWRGEPSAFVLNEETGQYDYPTDDQQ